MRTKSGEVEDENTSIDLKCFTWVETGKHPTVKTQKTSEEKVTCNQKEEIFLFVSKNTRSSLLGKNIF